MTTVAMDVGKNRTYCVIKNNGQIVREGYTPTTSEGFGEMLKDVDEPTIIVEASSTIERIAMLLNGRDIRVANPMKVKLISGSMKKTDRNDAHILLELYQRNYLPESYLPDWETRENRNLCRTRAFLVRQRAALKNRIKGQAYRQCIDFTHFNRSVLEMLKSSSPVICILVEELENMNNVIKKLDGEIRERASANHYARLIDTIPGIDAYSALAIASEIADVSRFPEEGNLFSYAGLVPRTYSTGQIDYKGRIVKGDVYLKTLLIECSFVHVSLRKDSPVAVAYRKLAERIGGGKARVAAARNLLRMIYYMMKRDMEYGPYTGHRAG